MTPSLATQHLSPEAIHQLVNYLPDYIKAALLEKSTELECSLETTIEMAMVARRLRSMVEEHTAEGIASFLDEEAFSFEDCLLAKRLKDNL